MTQNWRGLLGPFAVWRAANIGGPPVADGSRGRSPCVGRAGALVGAGSLVAVERRAGLEADPRAAGAVGRPRVHRPYLGLVDYARNLRRLGWTDAGLAGEGSDALIDALV